MVVKNKTKSKAMRAIIDYIENHDNSHIITEKYLVYKKICKESEVNHLLNVLVSDGLIAYEYDSTISCNKISLTDSGYSYFEKKAEEIATNRKESGRFLVEILKDFAIFAVGFLSRDQVIDFFKRIIS